MVSVGVIVHAYDAFDCVAWSFVVAMNVGLGVLNLLEYFFVCCYVVVCSTVCVCYFVLFILLMSCCLGVCIVILIVAIWVCSFLGYVIWVFLRFYCFKLLVFG